MKPPLIVVVLSTIWHERGGIQRFNRMLCRALDDLAPELGFRGTVISQDDTDDDYASAERRWSQLEFVPGGGPRGVVLRSLAECARRRPALMIVGLLGMTPVGVLCRPFVRGGFGFIAHGLEVWNEPRASRRFSGRRARFAFAVSRHTARAVTRTVGLPEDVVRLLPNTLDPAFEDAPVAPAPRGTRALELLTVSRLTAEEAMKGVDHALGAFARIAGSHPDAIYRIVGGGSDKPRLRELATGLGLGERVVFEENLTDDELAERYARCAAFVLPSGQEGFGIVFLEAMRFGRPCIGGNAGGTPDVVVDGETGFLVPYGEREPLAAAMDRLLGDGGLRERMGRAGHQRLLREFTFPRFRERIGGYLGELLGRA